LYFRGRAIAVAIAKAPGIIVTEIQPKARWCSKDGTSEAPRVPITTRSASLSRSTIVSTIPPVAMRERDL